MKSIIRQMAFAAIAVVAILAFSCGGGGRTVSLSLAGGDPMPSGGIELDAGEAVGLKAILSPADPEARAVWAVVSDGEGESAEAGTVSSDGVLTAGTLLGAKARVRVSFGGVSAEAAFSVRSGSLTLPDPSSAAEGALPPAVQTGSAPSFSLAFPQGKSLASENPFSVSGDAAAAVTVASDGTVSVSDPNGACEGKVAVVTVRYSDGTEQVVEIVVGYEVLPESIAVTPSAAVSLVLGDQSASLGLQAEVLPETATFKGVEWVSSAPSVAAVSAAGAVTPASVGSAGVSARLARHPSVSSAPVSVTVRHPEVRLMAWNGTAWADADAVSAAWGSKLSAALANAASPLEVSLGEGDAAVPYVFDRWSAVAPAANENPSTYAGAVLTDDDALDADGKEAYAVYRVKSYSVSFKVWDSAASAWADLRDGQDAAYAQAYDHGALFDSTGVPAVASPAGYGFAGWAFFDAAPASVDAALLASGTEYVSGMTAIKAAVTLYACYSQNVTVSWKFWDPDKEGGAGWSAFGDAQVLDCGSAYADPEGVPSSTTSGASTLYFTGWKAADQAPASPFDANALAFSDGEEGYSNDSLSSDATLYAVYEPAYPPRMKRIAGVVYSDSKGFMMPDDAQVGISGFEIGEYEVTQALWKEVWDWVDADGGRKAQYPKVYNNGDPNPSDFDGTEGKEAAAGENQALRPAEKISWFAACEFCNALSAMSGLTPFYVITVDGDATTVAVKDGDWSATGYRLPTECEWQYAAAGGEYATENEPSTGSKYTYAGSNHADDVAWYFGNSSSKTHQVRRKKANGYGLFDMSGNVFEWCWDWRANTFDGNGRQDYAGPDSGSHRVYRGGGWESGADDCPVSRRDSWSPSLTDSHLGFRLARSARD